MEIKDIKPVKVNFNLRNIADPDNETAVHCVIRFNNKKTIVSSVEVIKPKFWDSKNQRAKNLKQFRESPEFNQRLNDIETAVKNIYRAYVNQNKSYPNPAELRDQIKLELSDQTPAAATGRINLFSFIEQLIEQTKNGTRVNPKTKKAFSPSAWKSYTSTFKALERYSKQARKKIDFEDIDLEFHTSFKEYLFKHENISNGYFGIHIKNIKLFLNEALARELHANHKHQTKYFTKLENEIDNIYLNTGQLDHLVEIDLSQNKRLGRVRDLFLVGCWTGLRFSDFNNICKKDIQGDFLNIKTQKTNKAVIIPIHPTIEEVIKRYNGVTENSLPPAISNVKMNLYLKELGEIAGFNEIRQVKETKGGNTIVHNRPLYGLITTHTARRSFATNMYLMGVPSITIMAITGHLTETTFLKYIKVTPKEHAVKLKEIWSRFILKVV